MKKRYLGAAALAGLLLSQTACLAAKADEEGPALQMRTSLIASDGYVFGFPVLLMDQTYQAATEKPYLCGLGGPVNSFTHKFSIPGPDFRAVVRPNVDTLYSSAFLDLAEGPMVLEVPEIRDRFYLMAMLDAWTNNFAGPGSQSNGGEPETYLIAGPGWTGKAPDGMTRIDAPTNLVWIIGRTELKGKDDVAAVNEIQRAYKLHPLSGKAPAPAEGPCRPIAGEQEPEDVIKGLSGTEFFSRLDRLIDLYPPTPADEDKLQKLGVINVGPHAGGRVERLSASNRDALNGGMERGQKLIDAAFGFGNRGAWAPDPTKVPLGAYGDSYLVRAVVAQIGFGANRNEYAVYQNARETGGGKTLDGSKGVYELRFARGKTPPVSGFWSVTVYESDGFLSENAIGRYALGSNSGLSANEEGEIVITFAAEKPDGVPQENWLPVPEDTFEVTLRMFGPGEAILDGTWSAPPITSR